MPHNWIETPFKKRNRTENVHPTLDEHYFISEND
jgi:hypothetical protein